MIIDNIRKALEVITDKDVSIGRKTMIFSCVVILVILVEAIFKVTYNIHVNNKLEQLHQISFIRSRGIDNPDLVRFLDEKESEVLGRKHYSETLWNSYSWLSERISQIAYTTSPETAKEDKTRAKLSIFYTVLSGSTFLLVLMPVFILAPIWSKDYSLKNIFQSVLISILIVAIIAVTTFFFMLFPVFYKPIINYIIYFALQVWIYVMIGKLSKKKSYT